MLPPTATAFNAAVANFVLAGDPNGPDAPSWLSFDPARPALPSFTLDEGPVYGADPLEARLDLVQRAVERAGAAAAP